MAKANTVTISFIGDAKNLQKTFKEVGDDVEKSQSKFSQFGASAKAAFAGVGVAAVGAFGTQLFKLGADLEQMRSKSKTVFGDSLGTVENWAKKSANAMGLTRAEATDLATGMADLLKPMGFTTDKAAEMSMKVVGLSGALSAWSNGQKSATEVADILNGALLGEYDALKSLGISLSAAEVQARLAASGQDKLTGSALQQAQALVAQQLILEKSTDAQIAFNDGVQSTNEKVAQQQARFRELREQMANSFLPAMMWATAVMSNYAAATFNANEQTKGLQGVFFRFGSTVGDFFSDWAEGGAQTGSKSGSKIAVGNFLRKIFGMDPIAGSRAGGGPVSAGRTYLVGEHRPELFVPSSNGQIIPSVPMMGGGGSMIVYNVTVQTGQTLSTDRDVSDAVVQAIESHLSRGGGIGNGRGAAVVLSSS